MPDSQSNHLPTNPFPSNPLPLILGVTGASGLIYAVRTLKYLLQAGYSVDVVASKAVHQVWQAEQGIAMPVSLAQQERFWRQQSGVEQGGLLRCHAWGNVGATIASGSFRTAGMLVIPCSMSTVAKLATGLSSDLLERAADVQIKEGRKLVVVPRETPLSLIHLRNLTTLAEAGVRIVPAIPAWYHQPQSIEDLVDFVVARALDQLDIACVPLRRWEGNPASSPSSLRPSFRDDPLRDDSLRDDSLRDDSLRDDPLKDGMGGCVQ